MSIVPKAAVIGRKALPAVPDREPNLMRFGLRHLFGFVSLSAVLCAVMVSLGGVWPVIIGSAVALFAAHVFGTVLGTRLRDSSLEVQRWKARPGTADRDEPVALPQPVRVAELRLPATTLASFEKIGRWRHWFVGAGTTIGLVFGGLCIFNAAGDGVTWPGLALGAVSCGVMGAWAALLGVNFTTIARHTLRQATREHPSR